MSFDLSRLQKVKHRAGKVIAQCPACAAAGADKSGEHFIAYDDGNGKYGCVAHAGDKEHRRQIADLLGGSTVGTATPRPLSVRRPFVLPELRRPTLREVIQIAGQRELPFFAGCELAALVGHLQIARLHDGDMPVTAWVVVDSAKRCAQARRLDGKPWAHIGGKKAKTLLGSEARWPIGAADIGNKPYVALCEGGPDFLAAWSCAWWLRKADTVAPVCVVGAGMPLHAEALPLFRGKGVFLFPHRDKAGREAQERWRRQLSKAGALFVKNFDLKPAKDLNEWLTLAGREIGGDE